MFIPEQDQSNYFFFHAGIGFFSVSISALMDSCSLVWLSPCAFRLSLSWRRLLTSRSRLAIVSFCADDSHPTAIRKIEKNTVPRCFMWVTTKLTGNCSVLI